MPYIKPEQMIALQRHAYNRLQEVDTSNVDDVSVVEDVLLVCPICGNRGCSKDMVKANGVYVHPEDAADADSIEAPWRE